MTFAAYRFRALALTLFVIGGSAFAADWKVVPDQSSLRFTGTAQGEAFEGQFKQFDAKIRFDPAALAGSKFEVDVALASADTQNEERDGTLKDGDFFSVDEHPKATFVAEEFVAAGTGFEARGMLTLRGVVKPVTLAFSWTPDGSGTRLEGSATLNRMDFGVGGGDWADAEMIAHEVKVSTTLVLAPATP